MTIPPEAGRDCAVLMPTRNRPEILAETLQRLKAIGLNALPLWIADDGSDDPGMVPRVVEKHWPDARVIRQPERLGQAHGRNTLLRACERPFAILLDDDQYFIRLGDLFRYLTPDDKHRDLAVLSFQCRDRHDGRLDVPAWMQAGRASTFMGGAVMFNVQAVLNAGGYRPYWRYGYEEPELATRLYARGHTVWYDPSILVEHNHEMTARAARDEAEYDYLYARNAILMATLNMPLWFGLPVGLLRSLRRSVLFRRHALAKTRGTLAGIALTFRHWADRNPMTVAQARTWLRFSRSTQPAADPS